MGVTGNATLTVTSAQIVQLQVTPFLPSVPAGYGLWMQAVAIYSDATTRNVTRLATWQTSDTTIASIGNVWWTSGLVLSHSPGIATISANFQNITGSVDLDVTSARLTSIDITPIDPTTTVGDPTELVATGNFDDGSSEDITVFCTWMSSDTTVGDVSNAWGSKGEMTGFQPGTFQ